MSEKNIIVLPDTIENKKVDITICLTVLLNHEYDFYNINGGLELTDNDKNHIEYHLDTLAIYVSPKYIELIINDSLSLYYNTLVVALFSSDASEIKIDREAMTARNKQLLAIRAIKKVYKDMVGDTDTHDDSTLPTIVKNLIKSPMNLNTIHESDKIVIAFVDMEGLLDTARFLNIKIVDIANGINGDKNVPILLLEQIRILKGTVEVYLSTLEKCNLNVRVNDRFSEQFANLNNVYLHLLNKITNEQ